MIPRGISILLAALIAGPASAHSPSDSYITLEAGQPVPTVHWEIALRDLETAVGLDGNADGDITWGELKARQNAVTAYAAANLEIHSDAAPCRLELPGLRVVERVERGYAVLDGSLHCPQGKAPDRMEYALMFEHDPTHRGLFELRRNGVSSVQVLSEQSPTWRLEADAPSALNTFSRFLRQGMWHVWIGIDHLAFLIVLLLPAASPRGKEQPQARRVVKDAVKIVTAFTIAHSITLTLSILDLVSLPARLVESAIALTVLAAAIDNLRGIFGPYRARVAFALGLIHGLGFAGALQALGLPAAQLGLALGGFNLGVECAQLVIVSAVLALAFWCRGFPHYRRLVAPALAVTVAGIATVWLAERSLDLRIISL